MKQKIFMPGDDVAGVHHMPKNLFLIYTGAVAVYTRSGHEVSIKKKSPISLIHSQYEHLEDGAFFGYMSLLAKKPLTTPIITAIELSEIYLIRIEEFKEIFKAFPYLYQMVLVQAEESKNKYLYYLNKSKTLIGERLDTMYKNQ